MTCLEDPLEGDGRTFGDATHRGLGTLEAAEDDLVFAHEQRAEVANDVAVGRELSGAGIDAVVERDQIGLEHTRPEALGEVFSPVWMLHNVKLSRERGALKPGKPYASSATTLCLQAVSGALQNVCAIQVAGPWGPSIAIIGG